MPPVDGQRTATESFKTEMRYLDPARAGSSEAARSAPVAGGHRQDSVGIEVVMHEARDRPLHEEPVAHQLETTGFALATLSQDELAQCSSVDVFSMAEDPMAAGRYNRAIEEAIQRLTGAAYVRSTNVVTRRSSVIGVHTRPRGDTTTRGPVNDIHCDFTPEAYAIGRFDTLAERVGLAGLRYTIINVWKSVGAAPVATWPMAVLDSRSVKETDLVARISPENGNSIYNLIPNQAHRWYTYTGMEPNELLLFKQWDSDSCRIRFTPHTAFNDPRTKPGAPTRESCEVRAICFFDPNRSRLPELQALCTSGKGVVAPDVLCTAPKL